MGMHLLRATVVPYAIFALMIAAQIGLMSSQPQNGPGYLGCFRDCSFYSSCYSSGRTLPIGPYTAEYHYQSIERCFKTCWDLLPTRYTYAGLEYEYECFCGNDVNYARHRKTKDSECQDVCTGNSDQICGDSDRISIYRISEGVCSNDIGPPTNGSHRITNPRSLSYNLNNFKFFRTRVDFYCHDGYTLHGASSIQCIDTGYNNVTWNDTVPTCEAIRPTTVPSTTFPTTNSRESSTSVPLTTATAPPPTVDDPKSQAGLATGGIVGIAVGAISLTLVLLLVILILLWRKGRSRTRENTKSSNGTTYQNSAYGLTDIGHTTSEPPQTEDVVYNNVNPDNTTSDDVYAVPDDVTDTSHDKTATQPSHLDSPQDLDTTEWTDNTLYGRALFPTESAQSTENVYEQTDHMEKQTSGWEENIIYE